MYTLQLAFAYMSINSEKIKKNNWLYSQLSWAAWSASIKFTLGIAVSNTCIMAANAIGGALRKR